MEGGAGAGSADSTVTAPDSTTTVYNGSVSCAGGCGALLSPVAAVYATDKHCHNCRKKRHHRHVKSRMSGR